MKESTLDNRLEVWLDVPILPLRGMVVYPKMVLQFDVGRKSSLFALKEATERQQLIFLVPQKDPMDENPNYSQLNSVGVIATIRQFVRQNDDSIRILVEGIVRAKVATVRQSDPFLMADLKEFREKKVVDKLKSEALIREVKQVFSQYLKFSPKIPTDVVVSIQSINSPGHLADFIAANVMLSYENERQLLSEASPLKRLEKLLSFLEHEVDILKLENELSYKVNERIDKNQREYYLREQMKVIADELGEGESTKAEILEFRDKIKKLKASKEVKAKLLSECNKLSRMQAGSHEVSVVLNYLEECLALPWDASTKISLDTTKAQKILNRDHYGLDKVKEKVLETLAVKKLAPQIKGQILCLVGPPGVGKTSIARSIANASNMKYVRIALGGVRDESEIRGHRKTYIGAMPGRIISALKEAKSKNPLILLDEIDKLGSDYKGDPTSALLEVLDPEQNCNFHDHYIDIPFDLSEVTFIATANNPENIPRPLYDRMDVIEISGYTSEEKFKIAKQFLIPKQLKKHGMNTKTVKVNDAAIRDIVDSYTREAGVRSLERTIVSLLRKIARKITDGEFDSIKVDKYILREILGPVRYKRETKSKKSEVGVATGLAWTSVGGETLPVEVAVMPGRGSIELTGSLGDVMKESAKAAISCVRIRSNKLGIDPDFHKKTDIHIHVPEGAVPKDGPSAGITITTAIVSALSGKAVFNDIAMTGEVTLRGRVLPIGGLKEKTMAAYRYGIKTVIIPKENEADLQEIDETVKEKLNFVVVDNIDAVLGCALEQNTIAKDVSSEKNDIFVSTSEIISKPPVTAT